MWMLGGGGSAQRGGGGGPSVASGILRSGMESAAVCYRCASPLFTFKRQPVHLDIAAGYPGICVFAIFPKKPHRWPTGT